jgi:hypothetical protein
MSGRGRRTPDSLPATGCRRGQTRTSPDPHRRGPGFVLGAGAGAHRHLHAGVCSPLLVVILPALTVSDPILNARPAHEPGHGERDRDAEQ